jgi:hypothetical protein
MTVKQKYSSVSESFLYEFELNNRMGYKWYYGWWQQLKDLSAHNLRLDQQMKIDKILELHMRMLKKKPFRR